MVDDAYKFLLNKKIYGLDVFLLLGSGITVGEFENLLKNTISLKYNEISGFPNLTVRGHLGKFTFGNFRKLAVGIFTGRKHLYEGSLDDVLFFPRLAKKLNAKIGVFVCSAGGLDHQLIPGDIVVVTDFISFQCPIGIIDRNFYHTFVPISRQIVDRILEASARAGVYCRKGILAGVLGPTYETPAEAEMLRRAGATVASMSMVPEITCARGLGIECGAIAVVANMASVQTNHKEVLNFAAKFSHYLSKLFINFLELLSETMG